MEETIIQEQTEQSRKPARKTKTSAKQKTIIPKDIDTSEYILVRNGFHGRLVYKSRKTGEVYVWDEFGAAQEIELRELVSAKNSYKKFFINNWFMFDDDWVVDYLGVGGYYKNAIPPEHFDELFSLSSAELKSKIESLSDAQKKNVAYRAKELIAENKIDSLSIIDTLEKALSITLIER